MTKDVLKSPAGALEIGANLGSALLCRSLNAALASVPEVIKFPHTGKGLYFDKFGFNFMPSKWIKKTKKCNHLYL